MIENIGLHWSAESVEWGAGSRKGKLLGRRKKQDEPVDFRAQIAIYVLYAGYQPVYFGQTGRGKQRLLARLKQHRDDHLAGRWDHFSWFGFRRVKKDGKLGVEKAGIHGDLAEALNQVEAILIHTTDATAMLNKQGGRWGASVGRFAQVRDERLGPTTAQKIDAIYGAYHA